MKRRGRRWVVGLAAALLAGVLVVLAFPAEVLTAARRVTPREPPAFYSGNLGGAMATRGQTRTVSSWGRETKTSDAPSGFVHDRLGRLGPP